MQLILSYKSIIVSMLVVSFISAQNVCAESERSARYRSLIDQATEGHYEILKNFEPEMALTLWVVRLRRLRMYGKAESLMRKIVTAQAKTFGAFDLRVASGLKVLGDLAFDHGVYINGERRYAKSIIIYARLLPPDNPLTCLTLGDFAMRMLEAPVLTNKSFLLFQLQGLMLRALFPGRGEAAAAKECTTHAFLMTSKIPMGQWIQNLDIENNTVPAWEEEVLKSGGSNSLTPLHNVFSAQLNAYSQLTARMLQESPETKPIFPEYLDMSSGRFLKTKDVTEVPEIFRGKFAPGTISCKCFYNSSRKIDGFSCNVAIDGPTSSKLENAALTVTVKNSDYDKFKTLRKLGAEFNKLWFMNPLTRFPFSLRIDAPLPVNKQCVEYFGDIRASVHRNWHPFGFSYLQPIKIGFDLDEGGNVLNRKVLASSGDPAYDQVAFDSFEKKYSPLPKEFGKSIHLICSFGSLASSGWISSTARPNPSPLIERVERSELRKMAELQKRIVELEYGKKE